MSYDDHFGAQGAGLFAGAWDVVGRSWAGPRLRGADSAHVEREAKDPTPLENHGWQQAFEAILQSDYPGVMGFTLYAGFVFGVVNLIVDILYSALDPRVRLSEAKG